MSRLIFIIQPGQWVLDSFGGRSHYKPGTADEITTGRRRQFLGGVEHCFL